MTKSNYSICQNETEQSSTVVVLVTDLPLGPERNPSYSKYMAMSCVGCLQATDSLSPDRKS